MLQKSSLLMFAVVAGYVLIVAATFTFLSPPWTWVVLGLVLLKATVFFFTLARAQAIGKGRRTGR